ncbi:MAG: NAD(P)-dependent oxidoreductase [Anaerolineae bacterium]|nr:NAD(P)-dependent oxidoreductase [Anaerolineae bacterium]
MNVAVLGLGIMGSGVASVLHSKGLLSAVYNRSADKAEPFRVQGVKAGTTPREAAAGADVVIAVVGDDDSSRAVWLGDTGALAGMSVHAIAVEFSTLSPKWVRELNAAASARNLDFLDAPMTGSKMHAASGQIRLFVGGEPAVLERARPALGAVSTNQFHLGPVGSGATWKLINNMMAAVHAAALAEGLAFADRAGLNMEMVSSLIPVSTTASPMVTGKLPRMLAHDYAETDFSLKWMAKDVSYALDLGGELGVPLRTVEAAAHLMDDALLQGYGDDDMAAMAEGVRG